MYLPWLHEKLLQVSKAVQDRMAATLTETREPGSAREQVSLQFQTSDDARRARARGASALRVAGPRRDRIPALGMSLAGVSRLS